MKTRWEPAGKLALELDGLKVSVTIKCDSHYAAMELYEQLLHSARGGFVELQVTVRNRDDDDAAAPLQQKPARPRRS